jgi:hypothetical protein
MFKIRTKRHSTSLTTNSRTKMGSLCKYYVYKLFLIAIFVCTNAQNGLRVDVNTTRGPLFGFHFDQGSNKSALYYGQADIFLGIPYVLPPTGELRFAVIPKL